METSLYSGLEGTETERETEKQSVEKNEMGRACSAYGGEKRRTK
jgi:hypothetical protein